MECWVHDYVMESFQTIHRFSNHLVVGIGIHGEEAYRVGLRLHLSELLHAFDKPINIFSLFWVRLIVVFASPRGVKQYDRVCALREGGGIEFGL